MNVPPPGPSIPFKVETGDPTIIRVTYQGHKYILRLNQAVLAVFVGPGLAPDGNPNFGIQSGNVLGIQKDPAS
jgi:hypothetical protein